MKKILISTAVWLLLMTACKNVKEQEANIDEEQPKTQTAVGKDEVRYADASLEENPSLAINFEGMDIDEEDRAEVESWEALNTFHTSIMALKESTETMSTAAAEAMSMQLGKVVSSMPQDLNNKRVEASIKKLSDKIGDLKKATEIERVDKVKLDAQSREVVASYEAFNGQLQETLSQLSIEN